MKRILIMLTALTLSIFLSSISYAAIGDLGSWGLNSAGDDAVTIDSSGNLNAKNNLAVTGTSAFTGASTFTGAVSLDDITQSGILTYTEDLENNVVWASSDVAITATSSFLVIKSTVDALTFTSLPFITTTSFSNNTVMWVYPSSNSITIQDNGTLSGTRVELTEGTSLTLAQGDLAKFILRNGYWYQDGLPQHVSGDINTIGSVTVGKTVTITGNLTTRNDIVAKGVNLTTATASGLITANNGVTANADITANDDIVAKGIKLSTAIASGLITANGGVTANGDITSKDDIVAYGVSMTSGIASGIFTCNADLVANDDIIAKGISVTTAIASGLVTANGGITVNANLTTNNDIIAQGVSLTTAIASGLITANGGVTVNADLTTNDDIIGQGIKGSTAIFTTSVTIGTVNQLSSANYTITVSTAIKPVGVDNDGYYKMSYVIATDSVTLTAESPEVILSSGTATPQLSVTLPTAVGNAGLRFTIKKASIAAGITTIIPAAGMIDNASGDNTEIDAAKDYLTIMSDGLNWQVIGRYIQ